MAAAPELTTSFLSVRGLRTTFPGANGPVAAVDGVDFDVAPGEVLGIVGESGSGKSVTLRSILNLINPPASTSGQVTWLGTDLLKLSESDLRLVRGREIAAIFQEPMAALNPVLTIGVQIEESLEYNLGLSGKAARARAIELLGMVGIPDAAHRLKAYPHEFSGGMRQRAMIAIALAPGPKLLLADEPTTALDVTIQDQILKLLLRLKRELEMAVILVTHDLSVVAQTCDRVAVLYAGRVAETGSVADIFSSSAHAYTLGLLRSVPTGHAVRKALPSIPGVPPALSDEIAGCRFAPRCRFATDICRDGEVSLREISPGHHSACHHAARVIAEARASRS
jgi:peptide/nickel transport system ATP-binding protein/oligopeptide transport system ATP-binding protein